MRRRCCRNARPAPSRSKVLRRQLTQQRFADHQRQAGIAARHGMADPVAFGGIEKQYLIRLGDGLVAPQMSCIDPAIGKHQMRLGRAFLRTLLPAAALAAHIPDRDDWRFQQGLNGKFRHGAYFARKPGGAQAPADRRAELADAEAVEGKFQQHVDQAQQENHEEAVDVVVEIQSGRCEAEQGDSGQAQFRNGGPADHIRFDEPIEIVIGVDEGEQAGDPGVEGQMRHPQDGAERRCDIAEIVSPDLRQQRNDRPCEGGSRSMRAIAAR